MLKKSHVMHGIDRRCVEFGQAVCMQFHEVAVGTLQRHVRRLGEIPASPVQSFRRKDHVRTGFTGLQLCRLSYRNI